MKRLLNLVPPLLLALALAACRSVPATQPEASVKPGVNAEFLKPGLDPSQWVERFEKEGREVYDKREAIVKLIGARPGMSVADIGAGTGMFTALLAREVGPDGMVYAVDIVPEFVKLIGTRAAETGLKQIRPVLCSDRSVKLPAGSVDVAFICDTYHHFEFPRSTMTSLHRTLKPGGELLLVDFKRIPGESSEWTLNHVRAGQEVFEREIEAAGFAKIGESDLLKQNYIVRFQKIDR